MFHCQGPCWRLLVSLICLGMQNEKTAALTFDPFNPATVNILEGARNVTRLESIVRCEETDPDKICVCLVTSANQPFETWQGDSDAGYFVYFDTSTTLTAGTSYTVDVECSPNNNGSLGSETQSLQVDVVSNQPPSIVNYPRDTVDVNGQTTRKYDVIYTVQYTDPENDALTFNMTQTPDTGHFIIGKGDGKIRAAVDMRSASSAMYELSVTACDSHNCVDRFNISVTMRNVNKAPDFTNLPTTFNVDETAKGGDLILDLLIDDPDQYIDLNPVCVTWAQSDSDKFIFDMKNRQILIAKDGALDFESTSNIFINCTVSDGYLERMETLKIAVTNINEPPQWTEESYFCSIEEGPAGGPKCTLNAGPVDPEGGPFTVDVLTLGGDRHFTYDPATQEMTFTVNYDLDQGGYASDVTAVMTATDNKGASSTATVSISVSDVNDNTCQTDPTRTFSIDEFDEIQRLGDFRKQDDDVTAPNNQLYFEMVSPDPPETLDHIMVTRNGEIFYTNLFRASQAPGTFKITVHCIDQGVPRTTATTEVVVNYGVQTTTAATTAATTTATTEKSIWKIEEFVATFGSLMSLIGLGLILAVSSLIAFCCTGASLRACCKSSSVKPRAPRKVTPAARAKPTAPRKVTPVESQPQRPLPPVQSDPPINNRWDNYAWKSVVGDNPSQSEANYFHYH